MKRASSFVLAVLLATGLAIAQNTSPGSDKPGDPGVKPLNPQPLPPLKHPGIEAKQETKTKKNKGGKKGAKKGTAATPTQSPSPTAK